MEHMVKKNFPIVNVLIFSGREPETGRRSCRQRFSFVLHQRHPRYLAQTFGQSAGGAQASCAGWSPLLREDVPG